MPDQMLSTQPVVDSLHTQPEGQSKPQFGFDSTQPAGLESASISGFEETRPHDWEQQALAPDYDELIAAITLGEVRAEEDYSNRKRVLVVDEDLAARLYLRAKLALLDSVDVYEASSGEEAEKICQTTPFDGVLLEVNMAGGKDGYAVCRSIKQHSRKLGGKLPKIYIVTNRSGVLEHLRATLAGADAFMSKPPHPSKLHELLVAL
jgi:CheY-like chemotaxis protein